MRTSVLISMHVKEEKTRGEKGAVKWLRLWDIISDYFLGRGRGERGEREGYRGVVQAANQSTTSVVVINLNAALQNDEYNPKRSSR